MDHSPKPELEQGVSLRILTHVSYGLFALGVVTAGLLTIATIAAIVLAYIKRSEASGTIYASHLDWLIKTFWWGLLWYCVSGILTLLFIGWIGIFITTIWIIYRLIRGWLALLEGKTLGYSY
ncbi:DUF4870 family protein [Alcaligenes endophyticus]|uniref:Transmembrane protein n=1 Tax=Alcaligenes endophyticus TaxID=1929088 RepID=A0ABT8EMK7_9BURK|nr:hypothetical protein [Alcaligenes endophyticus]MCX5591600.1 hypothetical protein [Alcaligenes endophyticus]MDN4122519.1 hypothetical protein [Alcaligenes endophyticus]